MAWISSFPAKCYFTENKWTRATTDDIDSISDENEEKKLMLL